MTHTLERSITSAERYEEVTYAAADLFNHHNYDEAIAHLEEMARVNPRNIKVHEVLANAYLRSGKVDLAERELATIREIAARRYPHLKVNVDRTFDDLAAEASASPELATRYRELLKSDDSTELLHNTDAASHLSVLLMNAGRYEDAETVLTRYVQRLQSLREADEAQRENAAPRGEARAS
ncbi:MAG: tetratricopeptide repeat protein [Spirochaetota bacterium]